MSDYIDGWIFSCKLFDGSLYIWIFIIILKDGHSETKIIVRLIFLITLLINVTIEIKPAV